MGELGCSSSEGVRVDLGGMGELVGLGLDLGVVGRPPIPGDDGSC